MRRRRFLTSAAAAASAVVVGTSARAQSWPVRPIRLFIPWPPGQATDLVGRFMAEGLAAVLGQPVLVESRPGRGGMTGTDAVAKASGDGYTLLAASAGPVTIAPLVQRVPYNVERDLVPIAMVGVSPYLLVVGKSFPTGGMAEFVAVAKANPGKFTFSSSGAGATAHLMTEWFNRSLGIEADHVPFQGSPPALAALANGKVDFTVDTLAATLPKVRDGQMRALGVSLARGTSLAPDVPPIATAAGIPGYDAGAWTGLMAPAGTPKPIVDRLGAAIEQMMATPEARARLSEIGLETDVRSGDVFAAHLKQQSENFRKVVEAADIHVD